MISVPVDLSPIFVWNKDVLLYMGIAMIAWSIGKIIVRIWMIHDWKKEDSSKLKNSCCDKGV